MAMGTQTCSILDLISRRANLAMKSFTSTEIPRQRMRRVSKPVMEKRRRERINHSLETLRLLMLENTHNEKLKNPKVEKAEILESVVQFLKTEKEVRGQKGQCAMSREQRATCSRQQNYQDGMRSCLLRISRFMASDSPGPGERGGHASPSSPGSVYGAESATLYPQHLSPQPPQDGASHPFLPERTGICCDTKGLTPSTAACTPAADPVWRPWPL